MFVREVFASLSLLSGAMYLDVSDEDSEDIAHSVPARHEAQTLLPVRSVVRA